MRKMFAVAVVAIFALVAVTVTAADTINGLDHQKAVNKVVCEKMIKAKPGKTQEQCEKDFNSMAEMNPTNKTLTYSSTKSSTCITSLKGNDVTAANVMEKSIAGPCAVGALK